jgi:nucleoside-diphosphate-sugar epimerase
MIGALCDTLQRPRNTVQIIEETGTIGDPFSNVADITQMKKILAFEPEFGLEAGLQAFVSAYVTRMNQTINS